MEEIKTWKLEIGGSEDKVFYKYLLSYNKIKKIGYKTL